MSERIETACQPGDDAGIARAVELIRAGALVAFPTETVYGLGADATDDRAVAGIFEAKGRPRFNPLIAHFASAGAVWREAEWSEGAQRLAEQFWPGPLTLVLKRRQDATISLLASAGLESIAVRVPAHPLARTLLSAVDRPVAAPSANRSGRVSPTTARHVLESLGDRVALILDGGPCEVGVESTVLDLTRDPPAILRPGGLPEEALGAVLGTIAPNRERDRIASPGMLVSHYAPRLHLRLNATSVEADEVLIAFGPDHPQGAGKTISLSPSGDLREAAARFFAALHEADASGARRIAVMPLPTHGLGAALNDRLVRAAAPRHASPVTPDRG